MCKKHFLLLLKRDDRMITSLLQVVGRAKCLKSPPKILSVTRASDHGVDGSMSAPKASTICLKTAALSPREVNALTDDRWHYEKTLFSRPSTLLPRPHDLVTVEEEIFRLNMAKQYRDPTNTSCSYKNLMRATIQVP